MIVTFQYVLLKVTQDHVLLTSLSSSPDLGPLQSAPAPIGSILLNPVTEAAAVLQLAGACQFVSEKGLAKGSRKQTQQTKPQDRRGGPTAESSSRRAVPVTAPHGFEYTPPPTPQDHVAAPMTNGLVAVTAVAKLLCEIPKANTMIGAFGAPLTVLGTVVETRYGPAAGQAPYSQMSLASLEGLQLLLEVAALLAGMDGSLEQLISLMQPVVSLLIAAACGTSFEQRQAFLANRGKLLLQVLWRVGKAMSAESQQKQPVLADPALGNPDAVVQVPHEISHRGIISHMLLLLDALVGPCIAGSSVIAGVYGMQFIMM